MANATKLSVLKPTLRLPAARLQAAEALPYFRGGVEDLVPHELPAGAGRIGVTKGGVLLYDPELLGQWTAAEAGAVLLHEYGHIFSRHADRFAALVARGIAQNTKEDHDLFNVAADAEINDNLIAAGLPLPSINGCPPVTPKGQGLPEDQTAEQYFVTLLDRRQKQSPGKGGGTQPQSPGCGSGAGNQQEWEPDVETLSKLERDEVSQDITRHATAERILARQKQQGDVPAGLLARAEGEIPRSDIPWEDELRTAVMANADAYTLDAGDYTWTVQSRLQSALNDEYGEDAPVLPGEFQPLPRVAVAFDTSGSVSDEDLRRMCGHTMGIIDCLGGLDVTFLACDAAVHAVAKVTTVAQLMANMKGRGGTDFRPVFEAIAQLREQPDLLVFQTDLYGPFPDEAPKYPVTWLVTPGGDTNSKPPFGRTIYMDPEDRRRAGHAR